VPRLFSLLEKCSRRDECSPGYCVELGSNDSNSGRCRLIDLQSAYDHRLLGFVSHSGFTGRLKARTLPCIGFIQGSQRTTYNSHRFRF